MKKILIATIKPFAPEAVEQIKAVALKAEYHVDVFEKYAQQADFENKVAGYDGLIIRSDNVTPEVLAAANNLKIVVRAGAGFDNVDLKAATQNNVVVMNTPGQNSNAVAELAFGMMVLMARSKYNGKAGTELRGKKLGIHAYGNVGRYVARIAKGFGMEVYAFDPFVDEAQMRAEGIIATNSVDDLYSTCQYVSLHIPANDTTKKSINKQLLSKMPANSVLVNTARKEVIDEESLLELMTERTDMKYISDIAPNMAAEFEAKFADRVFFTPKKMGAQTAEANINAGVAAMEQIIDFFENGVTKYKVN